MDFRNEPLTDFSQEEARAQMAEALETVSAELGGDYSLVIDGKAHDARSTIVSRDPSSPQQIVGTVAAAGTDDATEAVDAARRTFSAWSQTEPNFRAEYLELMAAEMRNRRFELAAWEVYECGKPWAEADGDIAEAIDFCMYYAEQMRRMAVPHALHVPGEENFTAYRPRGVAVVIAPWNFPLAILTGMTAAALVTGNTVVMKPAEQSPVIAAKLMEIIRDSGIPDGVVSYLPGVGETVGPELVGSPDVDLIAFTGSREVGLQIYGSAAQTDSRQRMVKHVLAEMGGKNAIIVDDDADLDEAVAGVLYSAFGYAGQKCSACSRVIALDAVHDAFVERLSAAVKSLVVGPAADPGSDLGPVIDEESQQRILAAIDDVDEEWELAVAGSLPKSDSSGYFVAPHVFVGGTSRSRLAQEEIFGPVLAVLRAVDLDEAIEFANDTDYALTGGIYSRSPASLQQAREQFDVGNLYLNRGITGALVARQPFGGYRMSGIGTKAGGPDYLLQFVVPRTITENTMRRGFAPETKEKS